MKHGAEKGFTLLEILVALVLLSIAFLVIIRLFAVNLRGISISDDYSVAVARVESRMRELLDDEKIAEKAEKNWTEDTGDGYRISASVKDALKDRTDNLQFRLLDIGVTIQWTKWGRDRAVTLRTMKAVNKVP